MKLTIQIKDALLREGEQKENSQKVLEEIKELKKEMASRSNQSQESGKKEGQATKEEGKRMEPLEDTACRKRRVSLG